MAPLAAPPARALVFIGFMGAGKSTAAAAVAGALGVQALDSDRLLEQSFGHSIAREFATNGEQAFRNREEELVCELLADAVPGSVIALGGGSVLSDRVQRALDRHVTVLIDVDANLAWERAGSDRPLARDRETFTALHVSRQALYYGLADAFLPARMAPGWAAPLTGALRSLAAAPRGTKLLWAGAASGDYPVLVGSGLLGDRGWRSEIWPVDREVSRPFAITDENVATLHVPPPGVLAELIAIRAGERHKTIHSAEEVWRALVAGGMTRADHLVAIGGGVIGDLAGFCAATFQRGVPVVQVPTTLVAQVDSAYGGKTGVDLPEGKNYVGAYHQPAGVLVDPDTLATLPPAELAAGYAEVLKTALIAGGELWRRVSADSPLDERTILDCARTKLAVVAQDERDAGRRQILNLGHTVGHAIETVTEYARYRHGEAVGLGLLAALRLSGQDGLRGQVRELMLAHDLPVSFEGGSAEEVARATSRDKKRLGGHVPFVLLNAPGDVQIGCEVAERDLLAAVAELT